MVQQRRISEGSCLRCRKRRLRCDLIQPRCSRCEGIDQDCIYGATTQFKWVGGMAMRGHLASHSSNHCLTISRQTPDCVPSLQGSPEKPLCKADLVEYFNNVILPRFQIPDRPVELNYDVVMQDQTLRQVILAISQAHHATNSKKDNKSLVVLRKQARQSAIESFRHLLRTEVTNEVAAQDLFTNNVLLCMLDGIIEPSDDFDAPIYHLRGGFAMLSQWPKTSARMLAQDGLSSHLLSVFATMDLVHALLNGDKPFFDSFIWHMFTDTQTWFGTLTAGHPFLAILKAFSEMASLGHLLATALPSKENLPLIERCLPSIESIFMCSKSGMSDGSMQHEKHQVHWSIFCSIYRTCGQIFTERALRLKSIDDQAVQLATRRGVEQLLDDVLPGMMSHCLIFPILVIGSHCIHDQHRRAVFEALSPTSSYLSFGSLRLMTNFLNQLWNDLDPSKSWWECFKPIAEIAFLF